MLFVPGEGLSAVCCRQNAPEPGSGPALSLTPALDPALGLVCGLDWCLLLQYWFLDAFGVWLVWRYTFFIVSHRRHFWSYFDHISCIHSLFFYTFGNGCQTSMAIVVWHPFGTQTLINGPVLHRLGVSNQYGHSGLTPLARFITDPCIWSPWCP